MYFESKSRRYFCKRFNQSGLKVGVGVKNSRSSSALVSSIPLRILFLGRTLSYISFSSSSIRASNADRSRCCSFNRSRSRVEARDSAMSTELAGGNEQRNCSPECQYMHVPRCANEGGPWTMVTNLGVELQNNRGEEQRHESDPSARPKHLHLNI